MGEKGILSVEDLGALHKALFLQYCILPVFQRKELRVRGQVCLRSPSLECKPGLPAAKVEVSNNTRILLHTGDLQGVETGAFLAIVSQQRGLLDTPRPFIPSLCGGQAGYLGLGCLFQRVSPSVSPRLSLPEAKTLSMAEE